MQQAVVRESGVDPAKVVYSYKHTTNGFSATLTQAQVQRMRRHPSVASVTLSRTYRPATTDSYNFLELPSTLWTAASTPSSAGDGMVIGIIDTGVWPEHPSFDDTGYSSTLPSGWSGTCPTTSDFACNNKIIGGGIFYEGFDRIMGVNLTADWLSPRDSDGHGTWVAGAAAGNSGVQVPDVGSASGMAPGARLAIYKVFWSPQWDIRATQSDLFAAVDQAVADGVDVLSLSIQGEIHTKFYEDYSGLYFDDIPFLAANAAGVFVAFAAGDYGPPDNAYLIGLINTIDQFAPFYMTYHTSRRCVPRFNKTNSSSSIRMPSKHHSPHSPYVIIVTIKNSVHRLYPERDANPPHHLSSSYHCPYPL
ncbi:hypothetical protein CLOP_g2741 [Closterium sp. NIES-67]|nr:hypothetical protein CLOP_g2741 [Closterium sp. NIES-67]